MNKVTVICIAVGFLLSVGHIGNGETTDFRRLSTIFDQLHDHRDPYNASNDTAVNILFNLPEMNTDNYTAIYFNENVKYIVILVQVDCKRQYEKCGFLEMGNFVELDDRDHAMVVRNREVVNPYEGQYFLYVLPIGSKDHPLILRYILWDYDNKFTGFYNVSILPAYDKSESGCSKPSYKEVILPVNNKDTSMCIDCFSQIVSDYVAKFNEPLAKNQTCDKGRDEIADTSDTLPQIVFGVAVTVLIITIGIIVAVVCRRRRELLSSLKGRFNNVRIQLDDLPISRESEPDTGPQGGVEQVALPLNDRNHEGHVESESLTLKDHEGKPLSEVLLNFNGTSFMEG